MSAKELLAEIDSIIAECIPRGQYETFDDRLLHKRIQELKKRVES